MKVYQNLYKIPTYKVQIQYNIPCKRYCIMGLTGSSSKYIVFTQS